MCFSCNLAGYKVMVGWNYGFYLHSAYLLYFHVPSLSRYAFNCAHNTKTG